MARIAVLHHALGRFGGGEKLAILHALEMSKGKLEVELFYGGPLPIDWEERIRSNVPLNILPSGLPTSYARIHEVKRLLRHLRKFDVILVHHHICPFLSCWLLPAFKERMAWYCGEPLRAIWEPWVSGLDYRDLAPTVRETSKLFYGSIPTSIFLSDRFYELTSIILRGLDKMITKHHPIIIANSKYTKNVIQNIYKIDDVSIVYPGVEYQRYNNESEDRNEKDIKKYILAVGAMIPMKNYFRLLKAFSYVNHQQRSRIKLIIIGDGPLKKEILLFSRKLRLENVEFLSNISEQLLSGYYANCSFVIHVAVHEPFGLVPLEAAIHGKPAIVSHNGGISEFVEHERSGLIVDPYNPKKIAEAMEYLVDNERLTKEMGFRAMEKALNEFTIEKSTENLIKNLNSLF